MIKSHDSAWIEISRSAFQYNLSLIRSQLSAETTLIGVIKAEAYGHGMLEIAELLAQEGVTYFAVSTLLEAIKLRAAYPQQPILILGTLLPDQYLIARQHQLEFMIYQPEDLQFLSQTIQSAPKAQVHLKVDTGMGRVGVLPEVVPEILTQLANHEFLELRGICSHLATSDQPNHEATYRQLKQFQAIKDYYEEHFSSAILFHTANSDAIFAYPQSHFNCVRTGISLYGYGSYPEYSLRPILALKGHLTQIKTVPEGYAVGYGGTFITSRETRLGLVPLGYADGVNRLLSNRQKVLIQGQLIPMIGRVSMDQTILDLTDFPQVKRGEQVIFLGQDQQEEITADDWATKIGTISYEVLTSLSRRIPRYIV